MCMIPIMIFGKGQDYGDKRSVVASGKVVGRNKSEEQRIFRVMKIFCTAL